MAFDYDEWKCNPENYYDYDDFCDESRQIDVQCCRDYLAALLEAIYETGDLDQIENALEEICFYYGIDLPKKSLKIGKASVDTQKLIDLGASLIRAEAERLKKCADMGNL